MRRKLSLQLFVIAFSFIGIGTIADLASCVLGFAQPRYTLPLLVTVFASGCVLLFATNRTNKTMPPKSTRFEMDRINQAAPPVS
jgi:hypothetical protein